jgi:glyoxylase-like metal-dependent hydrolase (beta-lactamase superfamily II)
LSVAPSSLGTQAIGEASRVVDGIYQLKLPVPFPLKFVASYLLEAPDGWTVVDPGFDYLPARLAWESGAAALGLDLARDVTRIIVTHLHPDHVGLARWMQGRSGAPVWMLEGEIRNARRVWGSGDTTEFVRFLIRNGMDEETARRTASSSSLSVELPEQLVPLHDGEEIELGGDGWRVIHTPGHSDFHFVMHEKERGILLAGDQLLLRITPNIELWTHTAPRPLERFLASIGGLRDLEADLVLPGHGPLFHDLAGRVDELSSHHQERLAKMHAALEQGPDGEPATAYQVSQRVFAGELSDHQRRFALAETLAHLEYLVDGGRAERLDGGVVGYAAR